MLLLTWWTSRGTSTNKRVGGRAKYLRMEEDEPFQLGGGRKQVQKRAGDALVNDEIQEIRCDSGLGDLVQDGALGVNLGQRAGEVCRRITANACLSGRGEGRHGPPGCSWCRESGRGAPPQPCGGAEATPVKTCRKEPQLEKRRGRGRQLGFVRQRRVNI